MSRIHLQQASRTIYASGVIAYPTEAVFGLGCHPLDEHAVMRLLALKQRAVQKGLILVAADLSQLEPFIAPLPHGVKSQLQATWPGPVTWVVPSRSQTPYWLTGEHASIAVRVSAHPMVVALCQACDSALVSTSANRAGQPPARTTLAVRLRFGDQLDYILSGATTGLSNPTEIRDSRTGAILRTG